MPEVVHGSETAGFPSCTRAAVWQHVAIVHLSVVLAPNVTRFEGKAAPAEVPCQETGHVWVWEGWVQSSPMAQQLGAWCLQESVAHCQVGFP